VVGITTAEAETKLTNALAALDKAMEAQSYNISSGGGGRSISRADVSSLQDAVDYWDNKVRQLSRGGIKITGATPVD